MSRNFLKPNSNKTEAWLISSKSIITILQYTPAPTIIVNRFLSPQVKSLLVILDSTLSFAPNIQNITLTALICHIPDSLLQCPIVPSKLFHRLQIIPNSATQIITCSKSLGHINPVLIKLEWLPVQYHWLKKLLLTYKALHNQAPTYLCDLLHTSSPSNTLHPTSSGLLTNPMSRLSTMGTQALSCSGSPTPSYKKKVWHHHIIQVWT